MKKFDNLKNLGQDISNCYPKDDINILKSEMDDESEGRDARKLHFTF